MAKNILGLDLGTNSIGWALIQKDADNSDGKILGMGSRIIPMTQDIKDKFGKGNSVSQTADRTNFRGIRRIRERHLLRRERLHRVLRVTGLLPQHFADQIDFSKNFGKFKEDSEPKLAYNNNEFIFKQSFEEMLEDFKTFQPDLVANGKHIPYDWTIYYLRKKALTQKLAKEELAWLILNFNQKRGYYQLRGEEEEENPNKLVEFYSLKIVDVIADLEANKKGEVWYSLYLENGWIYRRSSKISLLDWKDKVRDFIVTTDLNDDSSVKRDKEDGEKRSFRAPGEDDWTLVKKKTEQEICTSGKTVGTYIYEALLQNPNRKIKGKFVRTIERKFYKDELKQILEKQIDLQPELFTDDLYNECVRELYRSNEIHQLQLSKRDFVHLFLNDIIFYQRPLKSKKSSIGECSLEYRTYKAIDKEGKKIYKKEYLKAIPKSHPLYQEFRLWQWIYNLKFKSAEDDNVDLTSTLIQSTDDLERIFGFLNDKKEVKQEILIKFLLESSGLKGKALTAEVAKFRWNYVADKVYPCNETKAQIESRLSKVEGISNNFLTSEKELQLWHIIYSVTDKIEFEKALKTFAQKNNLDESSFVENFKRFKPFESQYGSFSEKAIKKLLPLMRVGKYWRWNNIDEKVRERIDKILTGEYDEEIKTRVREKAIYLTKKEDFQGLQLWLAQYIVYDRHSEAEISGKWKSVSDLEKYINEFRQHALRNPIVEQVVTETLRVVKDIWIQYGKSAENFFDEIHIELGREMKNTADERKRLTNTVTENENTNLRIKAMLVELMNDSSVENVHPYSPMQQEALKIYEDGVLKSGIEVPEDIAKISKLAQPTKAEFQRYKLWLEQKYRSPYTGQMIPLNKLFTSEFQIEHIIPQSRYFDDSLSNKVICEAAVNQLKDKQLGFEFIKNNGGQIVETGFGNSVTILDEAAYTEFVKEHYKNNGAKRTKLLLEEIPDKMIERQLNDTRYISKFISNLLSNIVRAETNDDGVNSKNVVPGNGKITTILKQDWGLNDVWNDLILPRFERMNRLNNTTVFTTKNKEGHIIPAIPLELSKDFQKKRIDHRHHAMDALVVACMTRDHVQYLNNENAKSQNFHLQKGLAKNLRKFETAQKTLFEKDDNNIWRIKKDKDGNQITKEIEVPKAYFMPWTTFTQDAKNELEKIVVSFKQNLRVINKANNQYEKIVNGKKELVKQKGTNWAIRQSLHEETVSGLVNLPWVQLGKGEITTATRKTLDKSFNLDKIKKITDTGIQTILSNYLTQDKFKITNNKNEVTYNTEMAFSPEGIEELNNNITHFNNGKFHQPIFKVRVYEKGSGRFKLGEKGNKQNKYVQGAPNLFFGIYSDKDGNRGFETVSLDKVIERQKQKLSPVPEKIAIEKKKEIHELNLQFYLSPDDLIYVPTEDERKNINLIDFNNLTIEQKKRVFFVNDFSGSTCYFRPNRIAKAIVAKEVDMNYDEKKNKTSGSFDLKTASLKGEQIKETCIKLNIDRLGNISPAKKKSHNLKTTAEHIVSEPAAIYKNMTLKKFESFEEMELDQLKHFATLSPEELLKNHKLLSMAAFGIKDEASLKSNNRKIKLD